MELAQHRILELFVALGTPRRGEAARELARGIGAEELLVFVRDTELGVLIPAPGFPQTIDAGASWRGWLAACASDGRHECEVEYPRGARRPARCITAGGVAWVFVGGALEPRMLAFFEKLMPLLARTLCAEEQARLSAAEAADARAVASRANSLAAALEAARAEQARLNARLREEHRRKDDFLAMLAHELRNPLAPLVTSIELIRRGGGVATERQLQIMSRQVRNLSRLVEDLLDVSRVSRGRVELRRQRLRLADVVGEAVESSRPFLESRRQRIQVDAGPRDLEVHGDSVRLAQVLTNLLHNAGKYTEPGGEVSVRVRREDDEAVVSVTDNGLGIDPAMIDQVFDLFVQAPMPLERSQGGLGIGLTLVKALVELHGGKASVESAGLGHGSTFSVRLPLLQGAAAVAEAPRPPNPPPSRERALRVLVVDDNEDAAHSLADMLRLMGHHAEVAVSGLKALVMADDVQPDLVLLDLGLPELDGYEIARRLRRGALRGVRLVAITGYGAESDKRRSREAGFDEHVVKPVMPETLDAIISRVRQGPDARQPVASQLPGDGVARR